MSKTREFELEDEIKDLEQINRKLRFKIKNLENQLEKEKVKQSVFSHKTIKLLQGLGLDFKGIQIYYEQVSFNKNND